MSTLGAVLQGMNEGVRNGLDLYKTVQGEARTKRLDQLQEKRYAVEDERYATGIERQDRLDQRAVEIDARDHEWGKEKYAIEQERLDAAAKATAAYRNAQLGISSARLGLAAGKEQRAINKDQKAEWQGKVDAGMKSYSEAFIDNPDAAQELYSNNVHARIGVNQKIAQAQGFDLDAQTASELYAMPRPDGTYLVGRHTDEGFQAYDANPEREGEQALVMPGNVFARTFGGTEGARASEGAAALKVAQNEQVAAAQQQLANDSTDLLAKGAEAEQAIAAAQAELAELDKLPTKQRVFSAGRGGKTERTVYLRDEEVRATTKTSRGSRANGGTTIKQVEVPAAEIENRRAELNATLAQAEEYVKGLTGRQVGVKDQARSTLGSNLGVIDATVSGKSASKWGDAPLNASNSLNAGLPASIASQGLPQGEAQDAAIKDADSQMKWLDGPINAALKAAPESDFAPSPAKLKASAATAMENIGGIKEWRSSVRGQAAVNEIIGEMASRGVEYGFGFLAKLAMGNPKEGQMDAGFAALNNKVIRSMPETAREEIALLAAEKFGTGKGQFNDPEAAIMEAIREYNGVPTLGSAR